jgi:hypothetical protein
MKLRVVALVALAGFAGLGLVGAGAHASLETGRSLPATLVSTFAPRCHDGRHSKDGCDDNSGGPPIATQNLSVVLSAPGATGNGTSNLTLSSLGPTGSSFMTAPTLITITNNGNMTATGVALQLTDHNNTIHNNTTLKSEMWVCLHSNGGIFFNSGGIAFNELLTTVEGYGQVAIGNLTLVPGATSSYIIVYYAGTSENAGCGNAFTGYHALASGGYFGRYSSTEPYPTGTSNPAALSLTNPAEGESVTPTVTVSYLGSPATHGTITQVAPWGKSVTVANSGGVFGDHLAVSGASGSTTYNTNLTNSRLHVSSSGAITTSGGPLKVGTYTVSGTVTDSLGDTGTWTYTLTVTKGTINCTGDHRRDVATRNSGGGFGDHLAVSGSFETTTFNTTSTNSHLHVSSSGAITTSGGPLVPGTYTVSGTDFDPLGDAGTWTYTLKVSSS